MINALKKSVLFDWSGTHPIETLAFYRICFGGLMLFSLIRFWLNGWIEAFYITPKFHFSYFGFEWLPYPSTSGIYLLFILAFIGALGIILGLFYRFSAILFFVSFTYIELLDKTYYLNHYYFVSLIAFLLIFLPANKAYSMDVKYRAIPLQHLVPKWTVSILVFQISVVYIFAAFAKMNTDWILHAQPLKIWLNNAEDWQLIGDLLTQDWVAYFFSWFGLLYDLLIVFFLLNYKTQKWAFFFVFGFHFLTWLLFPIGVFPWVMMVGSLIFLRPEIHLKILGRLRLFTAQNKSKHIIDYKLSIIKKTALVLFILIQLIFPFRYLVYNTNLYWEESAFRFGWRVMLIEKAAYANFFLYQDEKYYQIPIKEHLTEIQEKQMSTQPDMILQFAHYLTETYTDTVVIINNHSFTFAAPEVHAEIYATLNGRRSQEFVNKALNLSAIPNNLSERNWITPLKD